MVDTLAIRQRHLKPTDFENKTFYSGHIRVDLAEACTCIDELRKQLEDVIKALEHGADDDIWPIGCTPGQAVEKLVARVRDAEWKVVCHEKKEIT
jgi:hypothetical protein